MTVIVCMSARTLPVALAHWMSNRLVETLDRSLDAPRTYGLTVIDPVDLDPSAMHVRCHLIDDAEPRRIDLRPDALAAVSRLWLLPDGDLRSAAGGGAGSVVRPSRPNEHACRRPALAVAVVTDDGLGVALRFEADPTNVTVVEPGRAAGLLLPVVLLWQAYEVDHRHDRGAA